MCCQESLALAFSDASIFSALPLFPHQTQYPNVLGGQIRMWEEEGVPQVYFLCPTVRLKCQREHLSSVPKAASERSCLQEAQMTE